MEYWRNEVNKSFKEGYRYEDEDTKRLGLSLEEISFNSYFSVKLIDLESHARRKYKCDLDVTIPRLPI